MAWRGGKGEATVSTDISECFQGTPRNDRDKKLERYLLSCRMKEKCPVSRQHRLMGRGMYCRRAGLEHVKGMV